MFEDRVTFQDTLNPAIVDILLLILLLGISLLVAFLVFPAFGGVGHRERHSEKSGNLLFLNHLPRKSTLSS